MRAALVFRLKYGYEDGAIVDMVIWRLPRPVEGSRHRFKYRLYYGRDGRRIVAYANERGKGDHRHAQGREATYRFRSPDRLIADLFADIDEVRSGR
jgi:hypothetical protein